MAEENEGVDQDTDQDDSDDFLAAHFRRHGWLDSNSKGERELIAKMKELHADTMRRISAHMKKARLAVFDELCPIITDQISRMNEEMRERAERMFNITNEVVASLREEIDALKAVVLAQDEVAMAQRNQLAEQAARLEALEASRAAPR